MYELRWNGTRTAALWLAWLALAAALSVSPFRHHLEYFVSPGVLYQRAIIAVLVALPGVVALYVKFRRKGAWRYEPRIAICFALTVCLLYQPRGTAAAAALLASCYAVGRAIRERLSVEKDSAVGEVSLSTTLGLGVWVLALIPLGVAGGYRSWVFAVVVAATLFLLRRSLWAGVQSLRSLEQRWRDDESFTSPLVGIAAVFAALFLGFTLAVVLVPAIGYDGVSYHLPAARYYLESGRLEPLPGGIFKGRLPGVFSFGHSVAYSYYPQSFEVLAAALYGLGGQAATRFLNPAAFALTILLLIAIARQCGLNRVSCLLGSVAAATLPFLHWVGSIVKNDFLAALFQAAALYALLRAREGGVKNWLVLFAALLGFSFGVKHTALFGAIPLGLLALGELRRRRRPARLALLMAAVFIVCGLYWHARTFALTGNPVYPANTGMVTKTYEPQGETTTPRWLSVLSYPWLAHFRGPAVLESPTSNPLGLFLLIFWPVWLLTRSVQPSRPARAVGFFCVLYFAYWLWIWGFLRYALVPIALLVIFTAARATAFWHAAGPRLRFSLAVATCVAFSFAVLPTMLFEINAPQVALLARRISEKEYLRQAMRDYPPLEFLSETVRPRDRVFSINNCAGAYAPNPGHFLCLRIGRRFGEKWALLAEDMVRRNKPHWLILPKNWIGQALDDRLAAELAPVYEDKHFRVFRLANGERPF